MQKNRFFEGWSRFKINNLGLATDTNWKFNSSVAKGSILKVRKNWGANSYVCRRYRGKAGRGLFWLPHILNMTSLPSNVRFHIFRKFRIPWMLEVILEKIFSPFIFWLHQKCISKILKLHFLNRHISYHRLPLEYTYSLGTPIPSVHLFQ